MKIISLFRDFIAFQREYNIKEFQLTREFLHIFDDSELRKFQKMVDQVQNLNKLSRKIKIESEKPYSELKYILVEKYQKDHKRVVQMIENLKEEIVVKYYREYSRNLFDDIEIIEEWVPNSKYFDIKDVIDIISFLKNSKTRESINNLLEGI